MNALLRIEALASKVNPYLLRPVSLSIEF